MKAFATGARHRYENAECIREEPLFFGIPLLRTFVGGLRQRTHNLSAACLNKCLAVGLRSA